MDFKPHEGLEHSSFFWRKDVKEAIRRILKQIRVLPNRDDKIHAKLLLLDGGGVNRFEVMKIIEEEVGKELSQ